MAFLILRTTARWLPLPVAQALGGWCGLIAYGLLARERALTWAHLRRAFGPRLSDTTCHYIARRVFVSLGKTSAEWFVLERLSPARIRRLVDVHGLAHLRQALAKGRGVIALSGHFGNWEFLSVALASLGFEGGVLARRLRYPEYERFLWTMRRRLGVATYARGSVKEVAQVLRANHIIGVVPDQDVDSLDGVFVDFFEQPAYTPVGPAALALMTGSPILPCFCVRDGRRFRVVIEGPIAITRTEDRTRDLVEITQAWSRVVESYIRSHPDQWAWVHRRWKTQPETAIRNPQSAISPQQQRAASAPRLQPVLSCVLVAGCWLLMATLVGCAKPAAPTVQAPAAGETQEAASPDAASQQMDSFTLSGYAPDGTKRWELVGTGASVEGAVVTIRKPNGVGFSPERTAYLTASLAQVEQTSRRARLEHEVTIHTSEGLWLTSQTMYWLPDQDEMVTDQAMRLETDHMLLRGRGATGYSELKRAIIQRDVELVLNPSSEETPGGEPPSHVQITCDGPLSFDYERNIAIFEHNVHVVDRQGDLYSDKLIAYLDRASRTITYAEALGHVRIVQGANIATGERAVYEPARAKVTLLGAPSLLVYPDEGETPALSPSLFGGLAAAPSAPLDAARGAALPRTEGARHEVSEVERAAQADSANAAQVTPAASPDASQQLTPSGVKGP